MAGSSAVSILLKATDGASSVFQRATNNVVGSVGVIARTAKAGLGSANYIAKALASDTARAFASSFPKAAATATASFAKVGSAAVAMQARHRQAMLSVSAQTTAMQAKVATAVAPISSRFRAAGNSASAFGNRVDSALRTQLTRAVETATDRAARIALAIEKRFPKTTFVVVGEFLKLNNAVHNGLDRMGAAVKAAIPQIAEAIGGKLGLAFGIAGTAATAAASKVASATARIASTAASGLRTATAAVTSFAASVRSRIASAFQAAASSAVSGMGKIRSAVVSGFSRAGSAALGFAKKLFMLNGILTGFIGAFAAFSVLKKAVEAFAQAEERAHRLSMALRLNGEDAAKVVPDMQAFAKSVSSVTTQTAGATMKLIEMGARMKIPSGELKNATQAAIGLSHALGIEQEEALEKVNQAMNGQFKGLSKLIPQLKNCVTEEQKLAIVQKFAADGFELAKGKTQTLAGSLERFGNLTNAVLKKIGAVVGPVVSAFVEKFAQKLPQIEAMLDRVAAWFTQLRETLSPIFEAIGGYYETMWEVAKIVFAGIGEVLASFNAKFSESGGIVQSVANLIKSYTKGLATVVITAFTVIETAITEWSNVWELAVTTAALAIEMFCEDVKHVFGTVLPELAAWFGRNWKKLIVDAFNAVTTFIVNWGKQLADVISRIWEFVTSGMEGGVGKLFGDLTEIASRNLLDGFTATAEQLPQILGRPLTAAEQDLASRAAKLAGGIGDKFRDKLTQRLGKLDVALGAAAADAVTGPAGPGAFNLNQLGKNADTSKDHDHKGTKTVESRFLHRAPGAGSPALVAAKKQLDEQKKATVVMGQVKLALDKTVKLLGDLAGKFPTLVPTKLPGA